MKPEESPCETFVEGEAPPAGQFELPGLWSINQSSPEWQTLVAGPTFRNQKDRVEVGAGTRIGGSYEPLNDITQEDDWGGFVSYQFLPFAELIVNVGKHEFVLVRLLISYALERP